MLPLIEDIRGFILGRSEDDSQITRRRVHLRRLSSPRRAGSCSGHLQKLIHQTPQDRPAMLLSTHKIVHRSCFRTIWQMIISLILGDICLC
jgi:hypothetical protein